MMRAAIVTSLSPLEIRMAKTGTEHPVAFSAVQADDLALNDEVVTEVIDRRIFLVAKKDSVGSGSAELVDESVEFRHLDQEFWDVLEEGTTAVQLAQAAVFDPSQLGDTVIEANHLNANNLAAHTAVIFDLTAQNAVINDTLWVQSMQAHKIDADQITAGTIDVQNLILDGAVLNDKLAELNVAEGYHTATGWNTQFLSDNGSYHTLDSIVISVPSWAETVVIIATASAALRATGSPYLVNRLDHIGNTILEYSHEDNVYTSSSEVFGGKANMAITRAGSTSSPGSSITVSNQIAAASVGTSTTIGYKSEMSVTAIFMRF